MIEFDQQLPTGRHAGVVFNFADDAGVAFRLNHPQPMLTLGGLRQHRVRCTVIVTVIPQDPLPVRIGLGEHGAVGP